MTRWEVGDTRHFVDLDDGWRVLDVGSGQNPHPRAEVLLERYVTDNRHRAGEGLDAHEPRLVIGDALAMPFPDRSFDYAIASHVAEHVDDPARLCRELQRVAKAGYIETPGWLGDMLLREDFHIWRVRRRGAGLEFRRVEHPRPLGVLADLFYALFYAGVNREDHWTLQPASRAGRAGAASVRKILSRGIQLPWVRPLFYTCFEWEASFPVWVQRPRPTVPPGPQGSSAA